MRWYPSAVESEGPRPALLWLHGGGFFRGSPDLPEAHAVAESLARKGVTVTTVGYRLAPPPGVPWVGRRRGRFPLALDDVLAAYEEVASRSPGGVVVGGASAGACLAAGAIVRALEEGERPAGAVLAYGFFHAQHPRSLAREQQSLGHRRLTHATWALNVANRNYAGSREALGHRFAFPGGHDLRGFPPTLVINAQCDNMRASGDQFAAELRDSGADVQHHVVRGAEHAFLNRPELEAFSTAIALIVEWMENAPSRTSTDS